ncbi:MAG: cupin domain-containing protein [Myxococcota bacterium]
MFPGRPVERENLFGGAGVVSVWDLLEGGVAPPFTAVLGCRLSPGGSVGRHHQDQFPEIVIGLSGDGEAEVDGALTGLGPGDVVHLPLGSTLALRNRSSIEPFRYLIVKARG